jgi:hypothetical protein
MGGEVESLIRGRAIFPSITSDACPPKKHPVTMQAAACETTTQKGTSIRIKGST